MHVLCMQTLPSGVGKRCEEDCCSLSVIADVRRAAAVEHHRSVQGCTSVSSCKVLGAEAKVRELAMRMNRNALLAERRSRFLLAIRQTYSDFFHDYFIDSSQVFSLRVRFFVLHSASSICVTLTQQSGASWHGQATGLLQGSSLPRRQ